MEAKTSNTSIADRGIAFVRIATGLLVFYHGIEIFDSKLMNQYAGWKQFAGYSNPLLMVYIGKGAELITGLLLTIGLFTRTAAVVLMITMLYLTFVVGKGRFWYQEQHPFLFVLLAMVFLFYGPGKWSVDRLMQKRR